PGVRIVATEIDRSPALTDLLAAHDVIVNAAGNMRGDRLAEYVRANVQVPEDLVWHQQSLHKPPLFLHLSSVAAIGPTTPEAPPTETACCRAISLYGRTKRAGELSLLAARRATPNLPLLILRPPSLFGPGDPCFFDLFVWAVRGVALKLCTPKKQFNLLYIGDLVNMLEQLVKHHLQIPSFENPLLHIGFPDQISDDQFSQALGRVCGRPVRPVFLSSGFCRLLARLDGVRGRLAGQPHLFSRSKVDEMSCEYWLQNFDRFHSWLPNLVATPLESALRETYDWYRRQGWLQ
ncbi:MAG TPA: NAD-dependent epimerase/dehydratase family protein, partial [Candidatus Ozemobacteraceae bacterium]|nr:NAD-dependent epimerase/dehydratase family protein [Candidatus Ozemobacteraceae bacterium]